MFNWTYSRQRLKKAFERTPLWPLLRPRRIHVYGVGAMKTGTHSVAALFDEQYRAAHEAHVVETTELMRDLSAGKLTRQQVASRVRQRDRRWRLECEAAHYLAPLADVLATVFPKAKFILTVREPRPWLRSAIDQYLNKPRAQLLDAEANAGLAEWATLRDLAFGAPPWPSYPPAERALEQRELPPLGRFLSYWAQHNQTVLESVPPDRLLVIRLCDLSDDVDRIASFLDISPDTLNTERSHQYQAPKRHEALDEVREDHLQARIDEHCGGVLDGLQRNRDISW